MTPAQEERAVQALEGINSGLKAITVHLVDIYARIGTLDDELETWVTTATEYGGNDERGN